MENNFEIQTLGDATITSPLNLAKEDGNKFYRFVEEEDKILADITLEGFDTCVQNNARPACLDKAGPREHLYFDPKNTRAAIVTCGGLCPGVNNVIRSLVMALHYFYGTKQILGIPYGYEGLVPEHGHEFIELHPDKVKDIHQFGGTYLGSSRGSGGYLVSSLTDSINLKYLYLSPHTRHL